MCQHSRTLRTISVPLAAPNFSTALSNGLLPQTLSLGQLVPHCVSAATIIRITNKLSLTRINYRATLSFDSSRPSSPLSQFLPRVNSCSTSIFCLACSSHVRVTDHRVPRRIVTSLLPCL